MHGQPLLDQGDVVFKDMHFQGFGNSFEISVKCTEEALDGLALWKELNFKNRYSDNKHELYAILCQYCAVIKSMAFRKLHEDCMELVINCLCFQF